MYTNLLCLILSFKSAESVKTESLIIFKQFIYTETFKKCAQMVDCYFVFN